MIVHGTVGEFLLRPECSSGHTKNREWSGLKTHPKINARATQGIIESCDV